MTEPPNTLIIEAKQFLKSRRGFPLPNSILRAELERAERGESNLSELEKRLATAKAKADIQDRGNREQSEIEEKRFQSLKTVMAERFNSVKSINSELKKIESERERYGKTVLSFSSPSQDAGMPDILLRRRVLEELKSEFEVMNKQLKPVEGI